MTIEIKSATYKCDCCGIKADTYTKDIPKGWHQFGYEVSICQNCYGILVAATKFNFNILNVIVEGKRSEEEKELEKLEGAFYA
jgi:hypothetical protein